MSNAVYVDRHGRYHKANGQYISGRDVFHKKFKLTEEQKAAQIREREALLARAAERSRLYMEEHGISATQRVVRQHRKDAIKKAIGIGLLAVIAPIAGIALYAGVSMIGISIINQIF